MTREIKQEVIINASPAAVFEALMDQKRHAKFTGEPAKISRKPGGSFTCYKGYITGFNLEIKPPGLIVQAWRTRNWPPGTWSVIKVEIKKIDRKKTKLSFLQVGVPEDDYREKSRGWRSHYWNPLKRYLEND